MSKRKPADGQCKFCGMSVFLHGEGRLECPHGKPTTYQPRTLTRSENTRATKKGWLKQEVKP